MASERYQEFGREKLMALAEMLEATELPGMFRMTRWFEKQECGTVGCAVGWGIELGVLPGLELRDGSNRCYPAFLEGDEVLPSEHLAAYFGLGDDDIHSMFMPSAYHTDEIVFTTKEMVIARIRQFVKENDNGK